MEKSFFVLNLIIGSILFCINWALGNFQGKFKNIFSYGGFNFAPSSKQSFSGNYFQRIVTPTIIHAIICACLQGINHQAVISQLWASVPFYWAIRILIVFLMNRQRFVNWKYEAVSFILSVSLNIFILYALIVPLISCDEPIFIAITSFRDAFWYAAIAYIAKIVWDITSGHCNEHNLFPDERRTRLIKRRYLKFSHKYDRCVSEIFRREYLMQDPLTLRYLRAVLYAIMIYEDYNRPFFVRLLEYVIFFLNLKENMSLGIMQIKTQYFLSSTGSIEKAIGKLARSFSQSNTDASVMNAILNYNGSSSYYSEVQSIYEVIARLEKLSTPTF